MKFFIVRHADDSMNQIGGQSNIGLTRKGIAQSCELRDYILHHKEEFNINKIISSDLRRAVQTVLPLAKALHLKVDTNRLFRALDWRDLNGVPLRKAKKKYPKIYLSNLEPDESFPGGGESPNSFYNRVKNSWIYIHKTFTTGNDNVLICTHGQQFNIFLSLCDETSWNYKTDHRVFTPV